MKFRIPLARPEVTESDRDAVLNVLRTPHLSSGPKVAEFEQAICDFTGAKHAVALNSGTSALQIAVRALRLPPGAEVILPSFTFSALLNVVLSQQLQPRFVDIDPETYNTAPDRIPTAVTDRTRLIIAVHTFGIPVDAAAIRQALASHARRSPKTIHLIEDACEALGSTVGQHKVGTIGDAGLFAFYPNKQITTGEGGMLITSDAHLADQARTLRNQGRDGTLDWQDHAEVGFSYRLSDINCALGISQLTRIEQIIERRQNLAEAYDTHLRSIPGVVRPPLQSNVGRISWFVYPVRLTEHFSRADRGRICEFLARRGIGTGRYFAPLHRQPVLAKLNFQVSALPNTEFVSDRVIALPFFNDITAAEIDEVCDSLREAIQAL